MLEADATALKARQDFVELAARDGVYLDNREVSVAPIGDQYLVWPAGADVSSVSIREVVTGDDIELLSFDIGNDNAASKEASVGGGIGFAYESTAPFNCYNLNGTSGASNHATWCWKKTRVMDDGDSNKDYYAYKRRITADPTTDSALDYGVTEMNIESHPTPGTEDRFLAWEDYSPAGNVTSGSSSLNLSISLGPITAGFSTAVGGGSNPSVNASDIGKFSVRWKTGFVIETGTNESTAFQIGVQVPNGETPYWGDENKACFSNTTLASQGCHSS